MQRVHQIVSIMIVTIVFFLFSFEIVTAQDVERILNYQSYIVVNKDRTVNVTETITVVCAGEKIRRGIYRTFPTKYKDRFGNRVRVDFQILEVQKNGLPEPYHIEKMSNGVKIYIGSENVYLDSGEYTYSIVYQTNRQLGFFDDFDELYWNVTGNDWDFTIERAEAIVELPPEARIINKIAYTGVQGARGDNYTISYDNLGNLKFTITTPLMFHEGLTIAVSWQKGVIPPPTAAEKIGYLFSDNQSGLIALLGLIVLFGYFFIVWLRIGKDPAKGVIYPQFKPPDGFSPAAVRYVMRMGYSDRVFAAAIVNMAVKGFLTIEEDDKGKFTLTKISSDDSKLSPGEKKIVKKLFGSRNQIELKQKNHSTIRNAITALKKSLKRDFEKIHFLRNSGYLAPGIILTIFLFAAIIFTSPERAGAAMMTFWLAGWTVGTSFLVYGVFKAWKGFFQSSSSTSKKAGAVGITLFALPFVGGELFGLFAYSTFTSSLTVLLVFMVILINFVFYRLLKAPTVLGRRMMDQIEGFKMYLETAEEER